MTDRVRIEAQGSLLERLVDKALEAGVRFWLIRRLDERRVLLETDSPGAREVLSLLERYHLQGGIVGVRGWPRLKRRLRQRWTLLCGLMLCAGLLAVFSGYVWRVEITDRSGEPVAREVLSALGEWGVQTPVRRSQLDATLLRLRLLSRFPQYSYAGVRVSGATLRVELARADDAPEVYDLHAGRDLVALQDGVVLSVTALSGTAAVCPGDTVRRGQLLLRGEERISKEETRGVRAQGEVWARVWREAACTLPLAVEEAVPTGRISRGTVLALGGRTWTLAAPQAFSRFEEDTREIPLGGLFAPLRLLRITRREVVVRRTERSASQAMALAREDALQRARALLSPGEEEIACSFERVEADGEVTVRALIEARAQIAGTRREIRD